MTHKMLRTALQSMAVALMLSVLAGCARQEGCTDPAAINYDAEVSTDDGSCVYAQAGPQLRLSFISKLGTAPFAFGSDVLNWEGRKMRFTLAQFYASGVKLGNVEFADRYLFVTPDRPLHDIGTLEPGVYDGLRFRVGVDSSANHANPAIWPSAHVLSSNNIFHSHWGWDPGYVFIRVEGLVDTSATKDGPTNANFIFHIGMDEFLTAVYLDGQFTTETDVTVAVEVDWLKFFNNIDLRADRSTHTTNDMPLATAFHANIPSAFALE